MKGFSAHFLTAFRLHFRNRMALIYGYLFPLIFLGAFWVLYRHEKIPLLRHMGELLTVSVLGGACFGLPTTLVNERERGVWRRYRLTPAAGATLIGSTLLARFVIILSSGLLQFAVALAVGMTAPAHPFALVGAFTLVSVALIGLGLVIASFAENVPAVQALGQCIFLPMLIIGGVAVPLESLPAWAQHLSAFFPGRYAVELLHACVTGTNFSPANFNQLALGVIALTAFLVGLRLFRWDAHSPTSRSTSKLWLMPLLAGWIAVGIAAEKHQRVLISTTPAVALAPEPPKPPWAKLTDQDAAKLDYDLPPDVGIVAPMAPPDQAPDEWARPQVENVRIMLPYWVPSKGPDALTRVRSALYVAAVPDAAQVPTEPYVPQVVLDYLEKNYAKDDLVKILTWIAQHPDEGTPILSTADLGLKAAARDPMLVKERVHYYAIKFVARLTNRAY